MKSQGDTVSTAAKKFRRVTRSDMTEFSWKLIVSIANRCVFQILNILNVKNVKPFYVVFQAECTEKL